MTKPIARRTDIVIKELRDEVIIYDLMENEAFCLNETSAMVWNLCNGRRTAEEIGIEINRILKKTVTEDFVRLALYQLEEKNLLEGEYSTKSNFAGLSRREVIRRAGVAASIALPIISSVVAPSALMAQSGGVAVLGACASTPDCQPGLTCKSCSGGCPNVPACCVNTDLAARAPGSTAGNPACVSNQAQCDTLASQHCCSGLATAAPFPGCVVGFGLPQECICN